MTNDKNYIEEQAKKIYVLDWLDSMRSHFLHLRRRKLLSKEEYASLKEAVDDSETATIIASYPDNPRGAHAKKLFMSIYRDEPGVLKLLTDKDKDDFDPDFKSPFL